MNLRKEQVVLIGTLLFLGFLWWSGSTPSTARSSRPRGEELVFAHHPAPDPELALPVSRDLLALDRDLFSPPRDTRPLPPLALADPPRPALTALRPPPMPPVAPQAFGKLLRAPALVTPQAGLFVQTEEDLGEAPELGGGDDDPLAMLSRLAAGDVQLSAAERAARIEGYKKLYDWIRLPSGDPMFGQIRNNDRFALRKRPAEAIAFVQVNPETGIELFPGQAAGQFERERVTEFGFADTPSNYIQQRRRDFDGAITPSVYANLMEFADECVRLRLEAREALKVAEEMYKRAAPVDPTDPAPRLGLGRCYEAGFDFERAYELYQELLGEYPRSPEVHVRLGQLEARLRLFESAEARLREAETYGRTQWRVQWALGTFLYDRGRFQESIEPLQAAFRFEPTDPGQKRMRARIRGDLGAALLAVGRVEEAHQSFEKALQAEPGDPFGYAGVLGTLSLGAKGSAPATFDGDEIGFELLVSLGLSELAKGNAEASRDQLLEAADNDPLRAFVAFRSLSWLAELSGYPEEAFSYIELASENDPTDGWTLYQLGRLLRQRNDLAGARDAFVRALDQELDFTDALVQLGDMAFSAAEYGDAERYFERALSIDSRRAEVHALRGLNFLSLNDVAGADESFKAALAVDGVQPLARVGQAWVAYRRGDSEKAITRFAELEDARRAEPESDPYRVFSKAQIERIKLHESKAVWTDDFDRRRMGNAWQVEEAAGPIFSVDGQVNLAGNFSSAGTVRLFRQIAGPDFVSIEMDVTVDPDSNADTYVFVAKERRSGGQNQIQSMIAIKRRKDGEVQVLLMDTATADPVWEDVPSVDGVRWWSAGKPVRLRIERVGDGSDATARLSIDGIIIRDGDSMRRLSSTSNDLLYGLAVEGQTGLPAKVVVDDVDLVHKIK